MNDASDIFSRPVPVADHRIHYGPASDQFGDLWLPLAAVKALAPLVVFFHGGWWRSEFDLNYAGHLCANLKKHGIAVWSVEYRRLGSTGGGWPNTFQDAAAGFDYAAKLANTYPVDLTRVLAMGHSAGGHLAFWIAGRHHIDIRSEVYEPRPQVALKGVIGLAAAVDLRMTIDLAGYSTFANDKQHVFDLMGGRPADLPDRYKAANPGDLLPFHVPQVLIQGTDDDQIPPDLPSRWAELAKRNGDSASVEAVAGADHFDVVDPESHAWRTISEAIHKALI